MENFRTNNEPEKTLLHISCKVPIIFIVLVIAFSLITFFILISFDFGMALIVGVFTFAVLFLVLWLPFLIITKNTYAVVTNKVIRGQKSGILAKSSFTYKLDAITNIRIDSAFGVKQLILEVTQGNGGYSKNFEIGFIANPDYVHAKLATILKSVKNDKDVSARIQAEKIKVEEKKAQAFEKMAENISTPKVIEKEKTTEKTSINYIDELKKLKELLDSGILTQEEFELKKKKILE